MIYIFIITLCFTLLLYLVYSAKLDAKKLSYDDILSKGIKKLPSNIDIAKEILPVLSNTHTTVEKNKDPKATISYYDHKKDIIVMSGNKNLSDYTRIVHVAHECIHSTQNKKFLIMNKSFSNIQILYFLFYVCYLFFNESPISRIIFISIFILIMLTTFFAKVTIESDASYRAVPLSLKYLTSKFDKDFLTRYEDVVYEILPKISFMYYLTLLMQGIIMLLIMEFLSLIF